MDVKRKSLLNTPKLGTPKGNKRASLAPKITTPKMAGTPKAATPALNGSAKKRKSMANETPSKKKILQKVEPEEEEDDDDLEMDSDELGSDEDMSDEGEEEEVELPKQTIADTKRKSLVNTSKVATPNASKTTPARQATPAVTASNKKAQSIFDKLVVAEEGSEDSDDDEAELGSNEEEDSDMSGEEEESALDEEEDVDSGEGAESDTEDEEEEKVEEKPKQKKKQAAEVKAANKAKTPEKKQIKKPNKDDDIDRTIFVGNLPKEITSEELEKIFNKYGKIESLRLRCAPVADPRTPKKVAVIKKEFHKDRNNINAYIVFATIQSALKALEMNGTKVEGHHLRVDVARSNTKPDKKLAVFVGNVDFRASEDDLLQFFTSCGEISHIRVIRDKARGIGKGFAYVNFKSTDSVELALLKNGDKLLGRCVRIQRCIGHTAKPGKGFKGEKGGAKNNKNRKPKPRKMGKSGDNPKVGSPKDKKEGAPAASFQGQTAKQGKVNKKNKKVKVASPKKQAAIKSLVKTLPTAAGKKKTKA